MEPERELQELVGRCLWDIFCHSHDVIAEVGRTLDLGSMRSAGALNSQWASITSRALLVSEAESIVTFAPMLHVGWARASSTLAL